MIAQTKVVENVFNSATTEHIASVYKHSEDHHAIVNNDLQTQFRSFVAYVASAERDKGIKSYHVKGQPYDSADEMRLDYHNRQLLKISVDHNNSPLLGDYHNLLFRFAHDCHHCQTQDCNFNLDGEVCAFVKFAKYVTPYCKANNLPVSTGNIFTVLLFGEIVGQVCYLRHYGSFPAQKIVVNIAYLDYANIAIARYTNIGGY